MCFHKISLVLFSASTHLCWLTSFLRTGTFSSCSCIVSNTVRFWSPALDHSHQNSLVNNPIKSYQTCSLQTYECLELERRGFAIICSTGNLRVYSSFDWIAYRKEKPLSDNGEWGLFQLLTKSLDSKLAISQRWSHAAFAKISWLFYFLLIIFHTSKSPVCRHIPEEILNISLTGKYWITGSIVTIWKSLPLRAHTRGEHVSAYTVPAENNAEETHCFQGGS